MKEKSELPTTFARSRITVKQQKYFTTKIQNLPQFATKYFLMNERYVEYRLIVHKFGVQHGFRCRKRVLVKFAQQVMRSRKLYPTVQLSGSTFNKITLNARNHRNYPTAMGVVYNEIGVSPNICTGFCPLFALMVVYSDRMELHCYLEPEFHCFQRYFGRIDSTFIP